MFEDTQNYNMAVVDMKHPPNKMKQTEKIKK